MKPKLWTKDFTIITLGSVVSMLGSAGSGFAISLLALDETDSVLLYALFMVAYTLPKLIMPLAAGPFLDRYPRRKVIYTLDFISTGIFVFLAVFLWFGMFNYILLLLFSLIIGSIDSVYEVAYDSLYPNLVAKENLEKAYSVSSMIYPLAAIMTPVAAFAYETVGIAWIFVFNAVTFFIAALFETRISDCETHTAGRKPSKGFREYMADFKEGVKYLRDEKGLLAITLYFFMSSLCGNGSGTLQLPYFKAHPETLGAVLYTFVMGFAVAGRLLGGTLHYIKKVPFKKRFAIAFGVYVTTSIIDAVFLWTSPTVMMMMQLVNGFICVTSFNIRIAATQAYVPDVKRARFNGAFQMFNSLGSIGGQLLAGGIADLTVAIGIAENSTDFTREIILGFNAVVLLSAFAIMFLRRKDVKRIYNRDPSEAAAASAIPETV